LALLAIIVGAGGCKSTSGGNGGSGGSGASNATAGTTGGLGGGTGTAGTTGGSGTGGGAPSSSGGSTGAVDAGPPPVVDARVDLVTPPDSSGPTDATVVADASTTVTRADLNFDTDWRYSPTDVTGAEA
jgi:hypothetical protein